MGKNINIELLAPAGDMEKLQTAFYFGADACYFAGKNYGLRAFAGNFSDKELEESVNYAHSIGKKAYVTVNILAHNRDLKDFDSYINYLAKIGVDALIVSDIGLITRIREIQPGLSIHVSTQANITNKYSAMFFASLGVKRLILARELSLTEIKEIRDAIPEDIEIECFVHGAMCISYSGRCLLSNYLTGRDSNHGACVQACRWCYTIRPEGHKEDYPIEEDERGTYILNSKDLNMIDYIDKLIDAGVTSFKIEGRMKSPYYVATTVNAYRRAIDLYKLDPKNFKCPNVLKDELVKTSHRKYTTGFYFGSDDKENLESSRAVQSYDFVAKVVGDTEGGVVKVEQRNRFFAGDTLEVLSPSDSFNKTVVIKNLRTVSGESVDVANKVQQILLFDTDISLHAGDILRLKNNEDKNN